VGAHESRELVAHTLQGTETVVLSKGGEEVLKDVGLVGTGYLQQLLGDLLLVGVAQSRGAEDGGQLAVGLEGLAEVGDGLGGLVEGGGLGGGGELEGMSVGGLLFLRVWFETTERGGRAGAGETG
jgi:hypothetical protein